VIMRESLAAVSALISFWVRLLRQRQLEKLRGNKKPTNYNSDEDPYLQHNESDESEQVVEDISGMSIQTNEGDIELVPVVKASTQESFILTDM